MSFFRYKLISSSGKFASGLVNLPYQDEMSVVTHLEKEGGIVIKVSKLSPMASFILQLVTKTRRRKLSRTFQAEFYRNIAMMLRAGLPLITALRESSGSSYQAGFENDIREMITYLLKGMSFSETSLRYKSIFPMTVTYLIRIGEETGKLDEMLIRASEHLSRVQKIISDTKQALMYPTFVLVAIFFGFGFWFYAVVPKIIAMFKEMGVQLPKLTVAIMTVSTFIQDHILYLLIGIPLTIMTILTLYQINKVIRKSIDMIMLQLPLSKTIITSSNLAFITEYLSMLLNAGIDLIQSIKILEESVKNEVYRGKLLSVREDLLKGEGIAESFKRSQILPQVSIKMINIGEHSGQLNEQLDFIAEDYRQRLAILVSSIGKMIEPIVLFIAGGIFAIVIGGLMLPIYDLVSQVSK